MTYDNYPKYVITRAEFNGNTYKGISVISLLEFLGGNEKKSSNKNCAGFEIRRFRTLLTTNTAYWSIRMKYSHSLKLKNINISDHYFV